ncbi:Alcohol dehydrogenase [Leucobacter sp. 7(1)]|uniref:NAD(P)-dependent alcohol dehydrogenase n=1 Tax=Leucobacter sp. 7(1) TaxID=1255613 RepID=UPI00097E8669|nr:NAD(P)-dependent alcohol dehydrogenase [Leucobacter sp. 7(1)]SJN08627.1 Alcohol dehydrogenase [Leucobacter sp. 7(1)]
MKITAAVARSGTAQMRLEQLELDELRDDEVRVRLVATGVCHTDALVRDQVLPASLPAVLGHEGAGIVDAVGARVTSVVPGNQVVLSFRSCGGCGPCAAGHPAACTEFDPLNFGGARSDGTRSLRDSEQQPVSSHFFGQSSFASYANVAERSVVRVGPTAALPLLGPLGCGISTGAGTVWNVLAPPPGASLAVFGGGAVGGAALLAGLVSDCAQVIVVDVVPSRLALAATLGAHHVIDARHEDPVARIRELTGSGAEYAIDTTGNPAVFRQMIDALAPHGHGALVGAAAPGTEARIDVGAFLVRAPTITGVIEGDADPAVLIPRLLALYEAGRFPFDALVTEYPFADIDRAFADALSGDVVKPILRFPHRDRDTSAGAAR